MTDPSTSLTKTATTNKELGFQEVSKFVLAHPHPEEFTRKDIRDFADGPAKHDLNEAIATFVERGWLECDDKPVAHVYKSKFHKLDFDNQAMIKEMAKGEIPWHFASGKILWDRSKPRTSVRTLRALATHDKQAYSIRELAEVFGVTYESQSKVIKHGVSHGWYESMDHHQKALMRGRTAKYYFLTEKGMRQYRKEIKEMPILEKRTFESFYAHDILGLDEKGQYINLDDEPDAMTDEEFEYYLKHGKAKELTDDDDIPM